MLFHFCISSKFDPKGEELHELAAFRNFVFVLNDFNLAFALGLVDYMNKCIFFPGLQLLTESV